MCERFSSISRGTLLLSYKEFCQFRIKNDDLVWEMEHFGTLGFWREEVKGGYISAEAVKSKAEMAGVSDPQSWL